MIPYGRQEIIQADIDAVVDVLRSELITQGPVVERFEVALAQHAGAAHAVVASSGTSALHLACLALGLGPGDRLWTSPITFVASANCARYCGADVDFVDIEADTGNLSVDALADALARARSVGRLPKIVMPVHMAGHPCDMESIAALAREYGFRIVEDAAHALGAHDGAGAVGHGIYSDVTVFSFHPVKPITTGEGGAALTNDTELAERMSRLSSHGITRDQASMTQPPHGPWYYEQLELGYNYRMTDFQAALGCAQLGRLERWVTRRNVLADRYDEWLADVPVNVPPRPAVGRSAFHLYIVHLADEATRAAAYERLRAAGIGANVHYIPVHLQPYYRQLGFGPGMYPAAEQFYRTALTLPLYPALTEAEQEYVVSALHEALS